MKKLWIVMGLVLALGSMAVACSDDEDENTGGTGGGTGGTGGGTGGTGGGTGGTGGGEQELIDVSGVAMVNPIAAAVLGAGTPSIVGKQLRLVRVDLTAGNETLASATIGEGGAFSFTDVNVAAVTIGMVITLDDDFTVDPTQGAQGEFVQATLAVCQAADCHPAGGELTGVTAFGKPSTFVNALRNALGKDEAWFYSGFVFGTLLSGTTPIAGASVTAPGATLDFLAADLTKSETELTGPLGSFVIYAPTAAITNVTPSSADYTFTPPAQPVGISPGVVFQVVMKGTPTM
jgi:hypothetical protein